MKRITKLENVNRMQLFKFFHESFVFVCFQLVIADVSTLLESDVYVKAIDVHTKMEVEGTVDSDFSFNKKSEVSQINDLQVLAWYFKN